MTPELTRGWLPIDVELDFQPAMVDDAIVRWMEFGSTPLAEPFFNHTVDRLREGTPAAREIDTDIETLMRIGVQFPEIRPAGFIFHISHCGSTLIANALKTSDRAVVVSESRAVSGLLRRVSVKAGPYLTARWDRKRGTLLSSLFSLFARYRSGEPEPLVLKFVSTDVMNIHAVRSRWPDVPCLIAIRDPVEVMVTMLKGGGWMAYKQQPEVAPVVFGWDGLARSTMDMTEEEYCGRVLGSFCASALQSLDGECMVVDYVDLSPAKMREIADFFGIELPGDGSCVDPVFRPYAKDPAKKARFVDDREDKQKLASVLARSAANRWANDAYSQLKSRRCR